MIFNKKINDWLIWAERKLAKTGHSVSHSGLRQILALAMTGDPLANALSVLRADAATLSRPQQKDFRAYVARMMRGEPVSRILGVREFWSLPFVLNAATLDPRQDTECLVEAALRLLPDKTRPYHILDLGTGSGCIIISILHELPHANGVASDKSPLALLAARENAIRNGVDQRLCLFAGDWAAALQAPTPLQKFDLIVSNPPYIPESYAAWMGSNVIDHDPALALWGGATGLDAYAAILPRLPELLAPGGAAILEMGVEQADAIGQIAQDAGLAVRDLIRDLAGKTRGILLYPR
jgi:release factor glutamine methyltransferase